MTIAAIAASDPSDFNVKSALNLLCRGTSPVVLRSCLSRASMVPFVAAIARLIEMAGSESAEKEVEPGNKFPRPITPSFWGQVES